jgi:glycosyltransferase involved in cell wall biosynthesis
LEKQGLQIIIEALKDISIKIPDVKLIVVGTGPFEKDLKKIAKINKVDKYVEFNGYIESHEEVEKILSKAVIGLATYKPDPTSFTYFADPGKIKNYLAAGLPVIITDVPQIAHVIDNANCGILTGYNKEDVAVNIVNLLLNKEKLIKYSDNAKKFARRYDWNKLFSDVLSKSLPYL